MGPRVKKPRSGKAKDSSRSAEAEREIVEAGDAKINEETESQEEVPKAEVDNGGEGAPPLKKVRGRQNVKKAPAKTKGASTAADEEADEVSGKLSDDTGAEENSNKVTSDCDDEETAPAKKGRGRTKKAAKDETVGKDVTNGEGESKEELEGAAPGARKGRSRKKKVEDEEPEVMPKKKDRGARKNEANAEEETTLDDDSLAAEESKQKATKREKKQPMRKAGKSKKEQHEEEKSEEEEYEKKGENGQALEEQAEEDDAHAFEEGEGDAKPAKKTARGKAAAKAADGAAKKKPAGRGKKGKGEELTEENDVPVDGKKLRVLVEHCKS